MPYNKIKNNTEKKVMIIFYRPHPSDSTYKEELNPGADMPWDSQFDRIGYYNIDDYQKTNVKEAKRSNSVLKDREATYNIGDSGYLITVSPPK